MSVPFLLLGLACVLAGVAMTALVVLTAVADRRAVTRSLQSISTSPVVLRQDSVPLRQRALSLALDRLSPVGAAVTPAGAQIRLTRQLDLAGNPPSWTVQRLMAIKPLLALSSAGACIALSSGAGPQALLLAALLGAGAFHVPDLLVQNAGAKRQQQIQKTLPDALDLLTITVEAGMGFDAALALVARETDGPLSGEFSRVLQEMKLNGRTEAFRALSGRTTVKDLNAFVSSFVQADKLGIPIGRVLREQSKEMRLKRRQRAEQQAAKVPVKILLPTVAFILPVLFVVVLAPAFMSLANMSVG